MKIALLTGSKETCKSLTKQLKNFLPQTIELDVYMMDEGLGDVSSPDFIIYSSQALYEEVAVLGKIDPTIPFVVGKRTINYDTLEMVVSIPNKTKVLLVNDLYESALEVKEAMEEIGLDHMELELYYPGCNKDPMEFHHAITPGELQYVPPGIENVINIGSRIFDFKTIAKVLSHLDLLEQSSGSFSKMYLEKIINVAKSLANSRAQIINLNESMDRVIDGFEEGLLIFDPGHNIVVFNDMLKTILKIKQFRYIGNRLSRVIYNKKLLVYLTDDFLTEPLEMSIDGNEYIVSKFKINQSGMTCASFKPLKEHQKTKALKEEAIRKGYVAKYNIDDIVGRSLAIKKLKSLIDKLGKTDMNILIQGESGTGKELAASAIHNHSNRSDAPFLAVNFSALPDSLIESELFGYAEGAFTGAKKGGKKGLFEEANGGTIFLDEIGDISLKVQSRLLRVLEEKEIMPVGGNEIRPVDVRIVAATNKNLIKMVNEKSFREDLYFRLKMGYIHLEPLRNRREDIEILLDHIAEGMTSTKVEFSRKLIQKLEAYDWMGNVRELKNTINYMLAVRTSDFIDVEDLPSESFFTAEINESKEFEPTLKHSEELIYLSDEHLFFLSLIHQMISADEAVSRTSLSEMSRNGRFKRTENQVRRILLQLKELGMVQISKGRRGIELTEDGYQRIKTSR
ncbi:MAG: sigma 54-interacting transcriptional regulator [Clostridiales bacterium]|jgi:transcriptional regulator with PAS, ATPase and Fis domain|nr:sigma 54-interacting transcriptional regulator [Clostridiales bacterium]